MMPIAVFESLVADTTLNSLGITEDTIHELQSINQDERPGNSYFVVVDFQEQNFNTTVRRGPRVLDVAVHVPWSQTREYNTINRILNAIDSVFESMIQVTGSDGIRVTQIRKTGRGKNLQDPGWQTTTRQATYSILYSEAL